MGRPRKDGATQKVRERLISAMADRLIREPVDAVTVTSLIKEVGCNRSTFYYYFADTEQLAEAALDAVVPVEIPQALLSFVRQGATLRKAMLAGQGNDFGESSMIGAELDGRGMATEGEMVDGPSIPDLVRRNSQSIDMLCAVLNGPNAALAQKRAKRRLLEDVLPDLDVSKRRRSDVPHRLRICDGRPSGAHGLPRRNGFRLSRRDVPAMSRPRSPRRPAHRPFGKATNLHTS